MTSVSSRARRGFSIIELLVSIGILVLLIAILMPLLSKARELARRTQCASGLAQLAQATTNYAVDNSGFLPQPNHDEIEVAGSPIGWLYTPRIDGVPIDSTRPDAQAETGSLWPYLKNHDVFHCPDDREQPYPLIVVGAYTSSQPSHYLTSYLMNCAVVAYYNNGGTAPRTVAYPLHRMPSQGVLFWEGGEDEPGASAGRPWNDGCSIPTEGLSSRHSGGSQIALFNGSVEWLSQGQIQLEVAQMPGRFWCNPAASNGR